MVTSGSLCGVRVAHWPEMPDMSLIPALGTVFPIFVTPRVPRQLVRSTPKTQTIQLSDTLSKKHTDASLQVQTCVFVVKVTPIIYGNRSLL